MSANAFDRLMNAAQQQRDKATSPAGGKKRPAKEQQQQSTPSKRQLSQPIIEHPSPSAAGQPQCSQQPSNVANNQEHASQAQDSPAAQHEAAVAAFKRAFSGKGAAPAPQKFQFLLVYDLEATCTKDKGLAPVEIIELSCVIVDTKTAAITSSFQAYVKPTEHPQLDPFCTELTGIQQQQVDGAELLAAVLQQHHHWLQQQGMFEQGVTFVPATWTDWDLKIALCTECGWRRIQRPDYLCSWVDLKRHFMARYKRGGNLRTCVEAAGLRWTGRAHSGLDDASNTARLAIKLMSLGTVFEITQTSENRPVEQPQRQAAANTAATEAAAAGAARSGSRSRTGTAVGGLASMQALAASNGAVGVFVTGGRWTGNCFCNVKAHLRTTKRPGPNHGRQFYSCGCWTIVKQSKGCEFFAWADDAGGGA